MRQEKSKQIFIVKYERMVETYSKLINKVYAALSDF